MNLILFVRLEADCSTRAFYNLVLVLQKNIRYKTKKEHVGKNNQFEKNDDLEAFVFDMIMPDCVNFFPS